MVPTFPGWYGIWCVPGHGSLHLEITDHRPLYLPIPFPTRLEHPSKTFPPDPLRPGAPVQVDPIRPFRVVTPTLNQLGLLSWSNQLMSIFVFLKITGSNKDSNWNSSFRSLVSCPGPPWEFSSSRGLGPVYPFVPFTVRHYKRRVVGEGETEGLVIPVMIRGSVDSIFEVSVGVEGIKN